MTVTLTLTDQDKSTLRTAAYGAVALIAAATTGSPHKAAAHGSVALATAVGPVGHVLAERSAVKDLGGRSVADLADRVLPALTAAMGLLKERRPAEADDFRRIVLVAVETAAQVRKGGPGAVLADMTRRITGALDAA
ncbi:hypothetical protein [Streptomyces sp. NPDC048002]|uniref:hypothetical protein n=1 Tax=Streptomyces sp. NPDC048002 TaxID=3154344 RepID=UPI0033EFDEE3